MTLEYKIEAEDIVNYMLFNASINPRLKKNRRRALIVVPFIYLVAGSALLFTPYSALGFIFWSIALVWFLVYRVWQRRYYVRYYKNLVLDIYKDGLDRTSTVELNDAYLLVKDGENESKLSTQKFKEIHETMAYIFVKTINEGRWILPKNKIADLDMVRQELQALSTKLGIPYNVDLNWKWK